MAAIDELVESFFLAPRADADLTDFIHKLDMGIFHAGKLVDVIVDQVCHPASGAFDEDGVATTLQSLLLWLGRLGTLVDALQRFERVMAPEHHPGAQGPSN